MATLSEILFVYNLTRASIYSALEGLSEEHALWVPDESAASIQKISLHLAAAERFWLSKFGIEVPESPSDASIGSILHHLHEMEDFVTGTFENADLGQVNRPQSTDRGEISMLWVLKRVTHHMNYHLGTLVYLRSILEPDWAGAAGRDHWATAVDAYSDLIELES